MNKLLRLLLMVFAFSGFFSALSPGLANANPPDPSVIPIPTAIKPSGESNSLFRNAIGIIAADDGNYPLIEQLDLINIPPTADSAGATPVRYAEYSSDGLEVTFYNNDPNGADPGTKLGSYSWDTGSSLYYLIPDENTADFNQCTLPTDLAPFIPDSPISAAGILEESNALRDTGAPYLISVYGNGCKVFTEEGDGALLLIRANVEPPDPNSPTNQAQDPYGQTWFDYNGVAHDGFPNNDDNRFVFISPFEIMDTRYQYPGTELNVIYAIPTSASVDLFGGGGQDRLMNNGLAVYWPVSKQALVSGDKNYSFDDLFLTSNDYCRGGIAVRLQTGSQYGRMARVPASRTNNGGCEIIKGDPENNPIRITVNSSFGFHDEGDFPSGTDLSWGPTCTNGDSTICRPIYITDQFYENESQASAFHSQFQWLNPDSIQVYHNNQTVLLNQISEPGQVQLIRDKLPANIDLPGGTSVPRGDDDIEIWTRTSGDQNCVDDSRFPKAILVVAHDRSAANVRDADTNHINTKGLLLLRRGGQGNITYDVGWNDSFGGTRCITVESIEDNAVYKLYENIDRYSGGNRNIPQNTGLTFIAYASRSCSDDCVGNSNNTNNGNTDGDTEAAGIAKITCETRLNNPLTWLACPLLNIADEVILQLDTQLDNLLQVDSDDYAPATNNANSGTYKDSWRVVKNIATIGVVFTAIFMVVSTALDVGFFSNYTVKKYMPRLVISVIAIQLSWVLGTMFIEIVNEIGAAVEAIVYYPFPDARNLSLTALFGPIDGTSSDNGLLFTGAAVGAIIGLATLGIFGILALAYTIVIALFTAFIALIFRKIAIIILLVLFPLAIAAWVLPGDDGLWKKWRTTFVSLLLMYPVLILAIASGKVFAYLTASADTNQSGDVISRNADDIATWMISIIAYVGGYVAVPIVMKSFAGVFSNLTGMVNDKSKGLLDRGKNNLTGKRDQQKQWNKDRKLEDSKIRTADRLARGKRSSVRDTWRTGTLGAGAGKRAASRDQLNKDTEQGFKLGSERSIRDNNLNVRQAQEEAIHAKQTAELNLQKTQKANETFDPLAIQANLDKGVVEENFKNAQALLESDTADMSFEVKMKHAATIATTSDDQSQVNAAIDMLAKNKSYDGLVHVQEQLAAQGADGASKWNASMGRSYGDVKDVGFGLPQELAGGETADTLRAARAKKVNEMSLADLAKEAEGSWIDLSHGNRASAVAKGASIQADDVLKNVINDKSSKAATRAATPGPLPPRDSFL